jgi:hypothetical protein
MSKDFEDLVYILENVEDFEEQLKKWTRKGTKMVKRRNGGD